MSELPVAVSRDSDAPAEAIDGILAGYRAGHPAVLPQATFTNRVVEMATDSHTAGGRRGPGRGGE